MLIKNCTHTHTHYQATFLLALVQLLGRVATDHWSSWVRVVTLIVLGGDKESQEGGERACVMSVWALIADRDRP